MNTNAPRPVHHLAGVGAACLVIAAVWAASAGLHGRALQAIESQALAQSALIYRTVGSHDYLGLSRVALAKALEGRSVALAYDSDLACTLAGETGELVQPARTLQNVATWSGGTALAGSAESLSHVCDNKDATPFFFSASTALRQEALKRGEKPSFVGIADTDSVVSASMAGRE